MAEELQGLLDRIQKEGVERAETESSEIVAKAQDKAKTLIADAQAEAQAILAKAEKDSELFQQRSKNAISQAARDVILSVGEAVTETLQGIVSRHIDATLDSDALAGFISDAIRAYTANQKAANIDVLLNDKQQEAITAYFTKAFSDAMKNGLTIRGDRSVISGFTVTLKDDGVQHDFTGEALTAAFGQLLRPQLASIVSEALQNQGKTATK